MHWSYCSLAPSPQDCVMFLISTIRFLVAKTSLYWIRRAQSMYSGCSSITCCLASRFCYVPLSTLLIFYLLMSILCDELDLISRELIQYKMLSCQFAIIFSRNSFCGNKMILWLSYLHNGKSILARQHICIKMQFYHYRNYHWGDKTILARLKTFLFPRWDFPYIHDISKTIAW